MSRQGDPTNYAGGGRTVYPAAQQPGAYGPMQGIPTAQELGPSQAYSNGVTGDQFYQPPQAYGHAHQPQVYQQEPGFVPQQHQSQPTHQEGSFNPGPQHWQQPVLYHGQSASHVDDTSVVPIENTDFCSKLCCWVFFKWLLLYLGLIAVGVVLAAFIRPLGLLMLAILPACTILTYLELWFRKSTIRMQMVLTFFEAMLWMVPIVILENIVNFLIIVRTGLPKEGYCPKCILSDVLQSYLVAGLFEESVKYLAVRRIVFKPFVVDPRALVVYASCAGAAFGTVEDVMYNLSYGVATAIVRALTSVPLHIGTSLVIGTSLADNRFFRNDRERWYKTLLLPIMIHGTYDFVTFLLGEEELLALVGFVIGCCILIGTYLYVRKRILVLLKTFPQEVNVHDKITSGEIQAPGICGCSPQNCPTCYF